MYKVLNKYYAVTQEFESSPMQAALEHIIFRPQPAGLFRRRDVNFPG